jgi:hypothetical protein
MLDAPSSSINTQRIRTVDHSTFLLVTVTIDNVSFTVQSFTIQISVLLLKNEENGQRIVLHCLEKLLTSFHTD